MRLRYLIFFIFMICFLPACSKPISTPSIESTATETFTKTSQASTSTHTPFPSKTKSKSTLTATATLPLTTIIQKRTASPTSAHSPTATITLTGTPQPLLVSHTWELKQVLLQVETTNGDGERYFTDPPKIVLYGNGLLIRSDINNGQYIMMARILSRSEMCALFNTLDQVGFLDYDPSVYRDPMDGLPYTFITVNIWKEQKIYGQVLDKWIYEGGDWWRKECPEENCAPPPVILPALAKAYKLLDQYNPGRLKKLSSQQMIIWAIPEERDYKPKPWPVKEISLEAIAKKANEENEFNIILNNPNVVRALEGKVASGYYMEGAIKRVINIRPLWPSETHFGMVFPQLPTVSRIIPMGTTMTCGPEDGLLTVP